MLKSRYSYSSALAVSFSALCPGGQSVREHIWLMGSFWAQVKLHRHLWPPSAPPAALQSHSSLDNMTGPPEIHQTPNTKNNFAHSSLQGHTWRAVTGHLRGA